MQSSGLKYNPLMGFNPMAASAAQSQSAFKTDQDEADIKQMLDILAQELQKMPADPEMDGLYLSKAFMIKLNAVSHKY